MTTTLVLGIGNTLLADEGAGVHAVRRLRDAHPDLPGVELLDGGTLSFTLAPPMEEADHLIVVDAAELGAEPGTVKTFIDEEMDRFLNGNRKRTVHEVGLMDLMDMVRLAGRLPARRALVGIQPATMDWGDGPTPTVASAIPYACECIVDLIRRWQTSADRRPSPSP